MLGEGSREKDAQEEKSVAVPSDNGRPARDPTSAETSEPSGRLDWFWKTSGIAANLTVAITVAIAVLAYGADREAARIETVEAQERERREASLSYVTRFQTSEILDARNEVYAAFLAFGPEQVPALGLTDEVRSALVEAMIESRPDPLAMQIAVANIVDFYDGVETCREAGLCDPAIIDASLAAYGIRFECFFGDYVDRMSEALRVPQMGDGLDALVERGGGC